MAYFTSEQLELIEQTAKLVSNHTVYQATRVEALDNKAFCAYEIIDLVEQCSASIDFQSAIAKLVLESYAWPQGTEYHVKLYFGLPY